MRSVAVRQLFECCNSSSSFLAVSSRAEVSKWGFLCTVQFPVNLQLKDEATGNDPHKVKGKCRLLSGTSSVMFAITERGPCKVYQMPAVRISVVGNFYFMV